MIAIQPAEAAAVEKMMDSKTYADHVKASAH
jgi:hypothetical protein